MLSCRIQQLCTRRSTPVGIELSVREYKGLSSETGWRSFQEEHTAALPAEKHAVGQLIDWLSGVPPARSDSDGEDLDESTRSYLASYKDNFARKSASQVSSRLGQIGSMQAFLGPLKMITRLAIAWLG